MSRASEDANSVVSAIEQTCNLYGVDTFRMQSRVVMVEGAAGRIRPMYFGKWRDRFGEIHSSGMADILARPQVPIRFLDSDDNLNKFGADQKVTVPLWIEGKSGKGRQTPKQRLFQAHVQWNGETYLLIHDDVRPLIEWFESRYIRKCEVCGGVKWLQPSGQRLATPCSKCNPRSEFKR